MAETGESSRVKVVDRRRFTTDGELREPPPEATGRPAAPAGEEGASAAPETDSAARRDPDPPADPPTAAPDEAPAPLPAGPGIADIIDLLAQQAMAFLSGQVPGRGRDPATARFFIDLLGVLKEKTAGRLTLEETNFLDDVLYQLRSLFVSSTR